jgi:acyl-CoA synthetase (AMP-forming)/AMP-acid ligase II
MISHRNVIANVVQISVYESRHRETLRSPREQSPYMDVILGLLPQSHIYALIVVCHAGPYRGDQVIVLPKFEINSFLNAIQRFHISALYLVTSLIHLKLRAQEY